MNVLFIAVDDLRPELGCYGVEYAPSPNIDRLARRGMVFRNHFVQVPTCGASRYAMLTGRSPAVTGFTGGNAGFYTGKTALTAETLPGAQSLPELFKRMFIDCLTFAENKCRNHPNSFQYIEVLVAPQAKPIGWDQSPIYPLVLNFL